MSTKAGNTRRVLLGIAAFIVVGAVAVVAYDALNEPSSTAAAAVATTTTSVASQSAVPVAASQDGISDSEADGLIFMIEEEKLARDVYLTLADLWGTRIFTNIAGAEQTHMDAVSGLIDTYGLEDPVGDNGIGIFENAELQQMFDDLVATGSESVEAALSVGALIEEVDIEDLHVYVDATDSSDITTVYQRLLMGSQNHLRAFTSQLSAAGVEYVPTVLDPDLYDAILASSSGHGSGDDESGGQGAGRGGGRRGQGA